MVAGHRSIFACVLLASHLTAAQQWFRILSAMVRSASSSSSGTIMTSGLLSPANIEAWASCASAVGSKPPSPILRPARRILASHRQSFLISVQVQPDIILLALYLLCSQSLVLISEAFRVDTSHLGSAAVVPTPTASVLKQAKRPSMPRNRVRREWRIVQVQISARSNLGMRRRWWVLFWRNMSGFHESHVNNGLPVDMHFAAVRGIAFSEE